MKQATKRSFRIQLIIGLLALLMSLVAVFGVEASVYAKKPKPQNNIPVSKVTILLDQLSGGYTGVDVVAAVDGIPASHCLRDEVSSVAVDRNQTIFLYGTKGDGPESGLCFHDGPAKSINVGTDDPTLISYP